MKNEKLKTKWLGNPPPKAQVRNVLSALVEKIGYQNIDAISVFVKYKDEEGETQRCVFTGGTDHDLDDVYTWMREEVLDE